MKKWLISAAALALAVTLVGPADASQFSGARQGAYGASIDYAPTPDYGMTITDPTPVFFVCFDDGRSDQFAPISEHFLPRKIPVTLVINADTIGAANRMTWGQIRQLIQLAKSYGTEIYIAQHTNDNMAALGSPAFGNAGWGTGITEEIVDSWLDPGTIIRETGIRPRFFVLPGDAGRGEWVSRNRPFFEQKLREWGYWWAFTQISATETSVPWFYESASVTKTGATGGANNYSSDGYLKPGDVSNPYAMFLKGAHDLGGFYAETPSWAQWQAAIDSGDVDLRSYPENIKLPLDYRLTSQRSNGWLLINKKLFSYHSTAAGGTASTPTSQTWYAGRPVFGYTFSSSTVDTVGVTARSWQWKDFRHDLYAVALATNRGGRIGLHSAEASDLVKNWTAGDAISGAPNDSTFGITSTSFATMISYLNSNDTAGHINFDMIAWILARLHHKGHIKLGGPEDFGRWVMGKWAQDVDVLGNPRANIPQYDIGDTIGPIAEYPIPRGWSSFGRAFSTLASGGNLVSNWNWIRNTNPTSLTGGASGALEYKRGATASYLINRVGERSPGAFGDPGGIMLGTSTDITNANINIGGLVPGKYSFQFTQNTDAASLSLVDFDVATMFRRSDLANMLTSSSSTGANFAQAYADTVIATSVQTTDLAMRTDGTVYRRYRTGWGTTVDFVVPQNFPAGMSGGAQYRDWVYEPRAATSINFFASGAGADSLILDYVKLIYRGK